MKTNATTEERLAMAEGALEASNALLAKASKDSLRFALKLTAIRDLADKYALVPDHLLREILDRKS